MVSKKLALDLVDHMENLKVKIKEFEDVLSDRLVSWAIMKIILTKES